MATANHKLIETAFRKSGVFPVDSTAADTSLLNVNEEDSEISSKGIERSPSDTEICATTSNISQVTASSPTLPSAHSTACQLLEMLEVQLGSPIRSKYTSRLNEGYDLPGSPCYRVWKTLRQMSDIESGKGCIDENSHTTSHDTTDRPTTIPNTNDSHTQTTYTTTTQNTDNTTDNNISHGTADNPTTISNTNDNHIQTVYTTTTENTNNNTDNITPEHRNNTTDITLDEHDHRNTTLHRNNTT
ncbi:uncharacterized protein [Ptychodera flava]|uniref:uncharacterized protein n=1 Tax=Ptychodera flava TaxID=63121 RepID=UPI00396A761D